MVNTRELNAEFVRNGYSKKDIAKLLGITEKTLYHRLNRGVFGSDEIEKLMCALNIKDPVPIFFSQSVT